MLEDSSDLEFKAFGLGGNHKQEVRSGYQLVDFSQEPDELTRATYNFEEDVITVASANAEATGQAYARYIITDIIKNNAGKTLKFACGSFDFSNGNSPIVQLAVVYNDGTSSKYVTLLSSSGNNTYAIANDTSNIDKVYLNIICNNIGSIPGAYNITITKPKFYFGTEEKEYEKYGVAPSIEHPTEVEAVNTVINETVCNKNLFDWESAGMTNKGIDSSTGNLVQNTNLIRLVSENLVFLKAGTYTISYKLANKLWLWVYDKNKNYKPKYLMQNFIDSVTSYTFTVEEDVYLRIILAKTNDGEMPLTDDYSIQLEEGTEATDYVEHQEQTLVMPVQAKMPEGDYFDWENEKEVHNWNKKIFDGTESWRMPATNEENAVFCNLSRTVIYDFADDTQEQLSTHFIWEGRQNGFQAALNAGIGMYTYNAGNYKYIYFVVPLTVASTVAEWKEWLEEQYENGTPLTNYYKASTETLLDFTPEQKAVKEQLKNLHSYKNVTHIFSTDQVAPVANVTYYKDLETVINNNKQETEARLEAIETLLSTTETSAMLLDNYETDLESEVEEI